MAYFRRRGSSWEYRIKFTNRKTGEPDETSKSGFKTKTEAKIAAAAAELELEYYGVLPDGNEL
ncbi:hypothetical protein D3C87_2029100 [compost metagenome]